MWDFNHRAVITCLREILIEEFGGRLSTLPKTNPPEPSVIITNTNGVLPPTTYISLNFTATNDDDSWVINSGLVTVTVPDSDNPPATVDIETLYQDTLVNFNIDIRVVSNPNVIDYDNTNCFGLMRDIRKHLLLDKVRNKLKEEVHTVVHLGDNRIRSRPDLLSKDFHEAAVMSLRCTSVDRSINYDSGAFDHVSWIGELKVDTTDTNPRIITGETLPPTP